MTMNQIECRQKKNFFYTYTHFFINKIIKNIAALSLSLSLSTACKKVERKNIINYSYSIGVIEYNHYLVLKIISIE